MEVVLCAATIVVALIASPLRADTAFFDLGSDDTSYFNTYNSGDLWNIDQSSGGVEISKGVDDGTVNPYVGGIYGNLISNFQVVGDFTATVDFAIYNLPLSDARNSLSELSFFAVVAPDRQFLEILRFADNTGTNGLGSWSAPPGNWSYIGNSSLTVGVFELQRSGATMTASIAPLGSNSFAPIASISGLTDPVVLQLSAVQISDGVSERPTGAMDTGYSNLSVTADQFIGDVPEPASIGLLTCGLVGLLGFAWRQRRVRHLASAASLLLALTASLAQANVFNMGGTRDPVTGVWTGQASLEFVTVGDSGNTADQNYDEEGSYGSVPYAYQMGKYDVTAAQYCQFLNAVAATDIRTRSRARFPTWPSCRPSGPRIASTGNGCCFSTN